MMETETQRKQPVVDSEHVKCPSCAGEMEYSPEAGALVCPYCGGKKEPDAGASVIPSHDYVSAREEKYALGEESFMTHCENCGVDIALDKNKIADKCAFCGSPLTVVREQAAYITPDGILPFSVSKEDAAGIFKKWLKGKFFSPKELHVSGRLQKLDGIYIPHFVYGCNTESAYRGEAGTHYYEQEMVTVERDGKRVTETRQVQKTRWTPVSGTYEDSFSDILINASTHADRNNVLERFDLGQLKPFSKEYVMGFMAENNSISNKDCWMEAIPKIEADVRRSIERSIHADELRGLSISTRHSNIRFQYVLLPVWSSLYSFQGKVYKFMINGLTGEINGGAPLSPGRIITSILLTLGVPVLLFLIFPPAGIGAFIAAVITLIILANKD